MGSKGIRLCNKMYTLLLYTRRRTLDCCKSCTAFEQPVNLYVPVQMVSGVQLKSFFLLLNVTFKRCELLLRVLWKESETTCRCYVNDLPIVCSSVKVQLYADNIVLYIHAKTTQEAADV